MNSIGERLKYIRKDYTLSQVQFAQKLGVTNAHISKIEKGGTIPSEALIRLICKEFRVNEFWLKDGELPIYIEDFALDEKISKATAQFNKLLGSDNENLRCLAAELELQFSNIADVDILDEKTKFTYLKIIINLFSVIDKYNSGIKESFQSGQLFFQDVQDDFFRNYKNDLNACIDELKSALILFLSK